MSRGVGVIDVIREFAPDWSAILFALLTQLGDTWFCALLLGLMYLFRRHHRDALAMLAAVWLTGVGVVLTLKTILGYPRPARPGLDPAGYPGGLEALYQLTAAAGGFGFPSGHSVNATILFGGLAMVLAVGTRTQRLLSAGGLIGLVGLTRLALGVHYLVDVLAGIVLGGLLLAGGWWLTRTEPDHAHLVAFGGAAVIGLLALLVTGGSTRPGLLPIAALVGYLGWRRSRPQ